MKVLKRVDQSVVVLLPGVSLDDAGWLRHEILVQEGLEFTVQNVAGFSALLVAQKRTFAPALLSANGKRKISEKRQWVAAVVDVCSQDVPEPNDLRPDTVVVYATGVGIAFRTKDLAQMALANYQRLSVAWLSTEEPQVRLVGTFQPRLVIILEQCATTSVIQRAHELAPAAKIFAVVTSIPDARRIRDLNLKEVTVFADLPWGKTFPQGVLPYAKLTWHIWHGYMLAGWQRLLWPLIPFLHNGLKVRDLQSAL